MVELDRRRVIAGIGLAAGAAAVAPLLSASADAAAETDPDALLKAGRFDEAARGYEAILRKDPNNAHAVRQRGYIALLSNRFADAEKYLTSAVRLAPDDKQAKQWLADCYLRQDKYPPAVRLLRAIDNEPEATWYEAVQGRPYQLSVGPSGRVPWVSMDPLPVVEASVNGGPPKQFLWDTGNNTGVGLTVRMAKEAGLRAVSQTKVNGGDQQNIDMFFGVLESFRMGDVEVRNIPVSWMDLESPHESGGEPDRGGIGAQLFAHFVTTLDWANQALIFRPRTPGQARAVRAEAARAGCPPLPMWIDQNLPYTRGSVNGSGPQVVCVNTGQADGRALGMTMETAERLKVRVDRGRPMFGATHGEVFKDYPCYPDEVGIGPAVARGIYCAALDPRMSISTSQFDVLATFAHTFFKPYAVTLDFAEMNLYITGGEPSS
ncbi:tetratricopeptide repeat protein [Actinoallomurus sp. CA-150999]|uniref:tetratricopeptide repeat protein n=1 Tax=Actinoallomurus sp. CA-150999 TaxID=3239887 RepID=UPI003D8B83F1